jgi:flagellar protein FlbD
MIELTRLNNRPLVVNSDLIKFIENTPDTVLTLSSGEKVVVSEPCPVVIEKIVEFRRKILGGLSFPMVASGREFEQRSAPPTDESTGD